MIITRNTVFSFLVGGLDILRHLITNSQHILNMFIKLEGETKQRPFICSMPVIVQVMWI